MDPRKERTLNKLLRAAEEIFGERSADEVTVEEIAERAGVAVGSIYNHFGSKAGLHAAVVERALEVDRDYMDRAYLSDAGPLETIYAAADEYLAFYLAYPDYFRMLAFPNSPGQYQAGHELAERLARSVDEQNQRLVAALRAGIEAGELRAHDPERVATVLWAAWNGIISLAWRPDALRRDEAELRRLLATATDAIANGLLPRTS
ncbi:DNA-binding transcriptional regulator, AcrR family [Amycolatopsis arida]|uniref:DNA-binding transcriptional regulator, AcrR family n=1 Tax=Amycolatopsis arida TaxID=587909 RepID=A0A1I6ALB7_9PSEU|nr:TetR/AcrR family transcriptional regulator [Amycolatopsis arida]TDX87373.1 AcrR family transcriptional regulator [Amycolatopsis arida]SFQ69495.1 DNA-binding transcriptional regulator, AcrR family [Amycolatopsis arida]